MSSTHLLTTMDYYRKKMCAFRTEIVSEISLAPLQDTTLQYCDTERKKKFDPNFDYLPEYPSELSSNDSPLPEEMVWTNMDDAHSLASTTEVKRPVDVQTPTGCCGRKRPFSCRRFCRKYFWEGQKVHRRHEEALKNLPENATFVQRLMVRHRRLIGMALPALVVWCGWLSIAIKHNLWRLFPEKYYMTVTMIFGSVLAGMTSEGGASVTFPVMTLAFKIDPVVARDFSFLVQSVGMTAAMFAIFFMNVKVEKHAVIFCSLGAVAGVILGLELIDPHLTPQQKKLGFVSAWFSFAFALFLLNWNHKRRVFYEIEDFSVYRALILVITGLFGGVFSAVFGSGVDICSFSVLALLFRTSEKVATPTSVCLMSINTVIGSFWRAFVQEELSRDALEFLAVCAPVVVIGSPVGSVLGTHFHRLVLAFLVYVTNTVALISALISVSMNWVLWVITAVLLIVGFSLFFSISTIGHWLLRKHEKRENEVAEEPLSVRSCELMNKTPSVESGLYATVIK